MLHEMADLFSNQQPPLKKKKISDRLGQKGIPSRGALTASMSPLQMDSHRKEGGSFIPEILLSSHHGVR